MKLEQKKLTSEFRPITITLETAREAELFCGIMDKFSDDEGNEGYVVLEGETELARKFSNAFTNMKVNF